MSNTRFGIRFSVAATLLSLCALPAAAQLQPGYAVLGKNPANLAQDAFLHVDLGVAYKTVTSEWDLHWHIDPPVAGLQAEYAPDEALLYYGANTQLNVPANIPALGLNAGTISDADRAIARTCGVYSTPQFVLIDSRGALFFRGNFNLSRYCSDERAQFARIAIESLCAGRRLPDFPAAATTAYGCEVPRANDRSGASP